jgi:hypothetical protein
MTGTRSPAGAPRRAIRLIRNLRTWAGFDRVTPQPDRPLAGRSPGEGAGQRQEPGRFLTVNMVVILSCTVISTGSAIWSANEARMANERENKNLSTAAITQPATASDGCASVEKGKEFTLSGTAKMAHGSVLWEITQPPDNSMYVGSVANPQSPNGNWTITIPSIGAEKDVGEVVQILVVSATPNAAKALRDATTAKPYKAIEKIPDGVDILDQMCVERAN